ncbi:hypothetical protein M436DRAFT_70884 [Aureobasidium namibiae CBS 147.97]|uniref:Uncharacterized protein n=1 Tax=Aureobasidium namibiae CBS 147.97 TaxID=1043004 RepID=A0A074WV05_9PEZI|nr:uncharacterized protein M436DRAFT_70884 [Aureobasidium namibiae CBS 147.97]KEQ75384.1 hypothetical protein M436DRAFT_70884 [Aureobasidium namibiae CBS 147.97]
MSERRCSRVVPIGSNYSPGDDEGKSCFKYQSTESEVVVWIREKSGESTLYVLLSSQARKGRPDLLSNAGGNCSEAAIDLSHLYFLSPQFSLSFRRDGRAAGAFENTGPAKPLRLKVRLVQLKQTIHVANQASKKLRDRRAQRVEIKIGTPRQSGLFAVQSSSRSPDLLAGVCGNEMKRHI